LSGPQQFSFANSIEQIAPNAILVSNEFEADADDSIDGVVTQPFVMPSPRRPRKAPPPHKPINVLRLAKARLKEVKQQLKQMAKLETEQAELERLIAAATLPKS
jgi:hypothetical protein